MMGKIGIITFLHNNNFGSSLQAFALQQILREWGFDCEHIDYMPDSGEKIRNLICCGNNPGLILEGLRKKQVLSDRIGARKKSEAIPEFYRKHLRLSPVCNDSKSLQLQCKKYDTLICGSDQIWNPLWLNPAYFLPFSEKNQSKIAYAASLGVSRMPPAWKARKIRQWLSGFDAVSVRESEGAELIRKITGNMPEVMPDPVCLLTGNEWEKLAVHKPEGDPYLLCYFIGENPEYWEKVQQVSHECGLDVFVIPVAADSFDQGYKLLDGIGPDEFLGAVLGAEAVCTDSFHCVAFSAIFQKRCFICRRDRDDDPKSKNSRIDSFRREIEREGLNGLRERGQDWLKSQLSI